VEAMAMGMAVVATDCRTGPAEILLNNEYGILLPMMDQVENTAKGHAKAKNLDAGIITVDEQKMADVVIKLLLEPERLAKYQKASLRRAEDFNCEKYMAKILEHM
jgi:glycosyltransferase involved in cell wall biosynthesis